jgi:hypothetical protein
MLAQHSRPQKHWRAVASQPANGKRNQKDFDLRLERSLTKDDPTASKNHQTNEQYPQNFQFHPYRQATHQAQNQDQHTRDTVHHRARPVQ